MYVPISPATWMFNQSSSKMNNNRGSSYNSEWEQECLSLLQYVQNQLPLHINVRYLQETKEFEFLIDLGDKKMWPKYSVNFIKEHKNNITELFHK
jgi:hypothetical protein